MPTPLQCECNRCDQCSPPTIRSLDGTADRDMPCGRIAQVEVGEWRLCYECAGKKSKTTRQSARGYDEEV
jgi:hypothetical protein